jgi:hypothetical protein
MLQSPLNRRYLQLIRATNFKIPVGCLLKFHPGVQPIFWRILVAKSVLYTALKRIHENAPSPYIKSLKFMTAEEKRCFYWRKTQVEAEDEVVFDYASIAAA